uniref:Uncharacterized protein n=1 Tax=Anguilla anguilla TaxID=7936 RepID=A0A0E9VV83_ANGAN
MTCGRCPRTCVWCWAAGDLGLVRLACFFTRLSCPICRSAIFAFCCVSIIFARSSAKAFSTLGLWGSPSLKMTAYV